MNRGVAMLGLFLFLLFTQVRARSQTQGLWLKDVRIGMEKQDALSGLRVNYELREWPGADAYFVANKDVKAWFKGQINFRGNAVVAVSEFVGEPYLDQGTINLVRDLYRLVSPYGKAGPNGKKRASLQVEFDDLQIAGFGDIKRISFRVEPGRQIHVGMIVPDNDEEVSQSAYLSLFRNAP